MIAWRGPVQPVVSFPVALLGVGNVGRAVLARLTGWSRDEGGRSIELDYVADSRRAYCPVQAIGEPDERGIRTVMATINGQLRPVSVRDRSVASEVAVAEKADTSKPGHVAAPFQGVVTMAVAEGDEVAAGDTVATIEAMKMEASITAPVAGKVERLAVTGTQAVEGGDLVLVLS